MTLSELIDFYDDLIEVSELEARADRGGDANG